jgi:nucleotide-binding universal stress UspA family protein
MNAPHPQAVALPVPLTRSDRLQWEVADARVSIRQGLVVPQILAEVAASGSDVLCFGYHRGGPPGIIEGSSTARQLAHTTPVSVLGIPL